MKSPSCLLLAWFFPLFSLPVKASFTLFEYKKGEAHKEQKLPPAQDISLLGILYHNAQQWSLWFTEGTLCSESPSWIIGTLRIKSVSPDKITCLQYNASTQAAEVIVITPLSEIRRQDASQQ